MVTMQTGIQMIHVDLIDPDPLNPQEQDLATFNELVESVKQDGMLESVTVVPHGDGRFRLVAGEHRWKAAKLAGVAEIPAIVVPPEQWSDDERRMRLVKMNVLKGKLNPTKFIELWGELSKRIPDQNELKRRMGFDARDAELSRLIARMSAAMPDERMKKELRQRGSKIRSVEDLSTTVQSLYARYGSTLESNFVVFTFLGQTHLMVRCPPETFEPIRRLAESVGEAEGDLAQTLADLAAKHLSDGAGA